MFRAIDAIARTFLGMKYSLISDVKEFGIIIIFRDLIIRAFPVLLSKTSDARTILDLDERESCSYQVARIVEAFFPPSME